MKNIAIFEISILECAQLPNFVKKWKCLSMRSKMPYLGFLGENSEKLLSDLKSAPSNLSNGEILWKNEYA